MSEIEEGNERTNKVQRQRHMKSWLKFCVNP